MALAVVAHHRVAGIQHVCYGTERIGYDVLERLAPVGVEWCFGSRVCMPSCCTTCERLVSCTEVASARHCVPVHMPCNRWQVDEVKAVHRSMLHRQCIARCHVTTKEVCDPLPQVPERDRIVSSSNEVDSLRDHIECECIRCSQLLW